MSDQAALPLQFLHANPELPPQLARLRHQGGKHWAEFAAHVIGEKIVALDREVRELPGSGDWHALTSLTASAPYRQVQRRLGDGQGLARAATIVQKAFAIGLATAGRTGERAGSEALAAVNATPGLTRHAMSEPWKEIPVSAQPLGAVGRDREHDG
ncbi:MULTISPECIES: hypothetical protein [Luteimonas]|nr:MULTISPECIES: hypothetical protein [Luteimonas]RPD88455.1 hypothetical protein EGK76_04685 [Luteimonas sp. 100069]